MIILASASPRRRELLNKMGIHDFIVRPSCREEPFDPSLEPGRAVERIALMKAEDAAVMSPEDIVIAADTLVFLDGTPLGKPRDRQDAGRMLRALSGREHQVITGIAVTVRGGVYTDFVETAVKFLPLTDKMIEWYLATGEPLDKAGAYGIQGAGGVLVESIRGDYYNVVGLPIARLAAMLSKAGYSVFGEKGEEA